MLESLFSLLALGALAWYWLDGTRVREIGIEAAREACRAEALQFLDDTVVQRGLRCIRNDRGHLILQRSFNFEYSLSGDDRHPGLIVLQGHEVTLLQLSKPAAATESLLH